MLRLAAVPIILFINRYSNKAFDDLPKVNTESLDTIISVLAESISMLPDVHWEEFRNVLERMALQRQKIADSVKLLSDKLAEKSAESAE